MKFEILGINDTADTCNCCGKSGLKRVVWIKNLDNGEITHLGTTCALNPAKGFGYDFIGKIARAIDRHSKK